MAYIDPEGMFGGDRMAMLSDAAKMAWPWFWCASNTVGRVELNYREFVNGAFRQFRKPPTEKQFWEWVTEFHEAFLLFVYQSNGQAWGQWDVSERYLPTYKTKNDRLTPAPVAKEFIVWRSCYTQRKSSDLSSKCRLFSVSENFSKVSESSEEFPIGEERRDYGEERKTTQRAPETGALAVVSPPSQRPRKPHRTIEEIERALGPRAEWWGWFWKAYPCHEGKRDAMDAYERVVSTYELAVEIYKGAQRYAAKVAADPTIRVKWAQGWLNAERWKDEIDARASPSPARQRDLVANVTREIQESLLKGEQPW